MIRAVRAFRKVLAPLPVTPKCSSATCWPLASFPDLTAARAGFVLAGDLTVAAAMVDVLGLDKDVVDDLLVFVTSDRYANLRDRLGITLG